MGTLANIKDSAEMIHKGIFHLGLYCLLLKIKNNIKGQKWIIL